MVPLVGCEVQPLAAAELPHGILVRQQKTEIKVYCDSPAEQAAWLATLRSARDISAHTLEITRLSKQKASEERDEVRQREVLASKEAQAQREEANVNKAMAMRLKGDVVELETKLRDMVAEVDQTKRKKQELNMELAKTAEEKEKEKEKVRDRPSPALSSDACRVGLLVFARVSPILPRASMRECLSFSHGHMRAHVASCTRVIGRTAHVAAGA